jgi:hypothetical protein
VEEAKSALEAEGDVFGVEVRDKGKLLSRWQARSRRLCDDFELAEPILALREVLLRGLAPILQGHPGVGDGPSCLVRHLCEISQAARDAGAVNVAVGAMHRVEKLTAGEAVGGVLTPQRAHWKLEQSRVLWAKGERDLAIRTAKAVVQALAQREAVAMGPLPEGVVRLQVQALQMAGEWMASAKTEGTSAIIAEYLRPAVGKAVDHTAQKREAHLILATFLAELYQQRRERLKSEEWVKKRQLLESRKQRLGALTEHRDTLGERDPLRQQLYRTIIILERELKLDEEEYRGLSASIDDFLLEALR